jgi:dienelactone hydrolase
MRVLAGFVLLVAALAGCTSSSTPASPVHVTASPRASGLDQPVDLRVTGLAGHEQATVRLTSTDASGVPWSSSATYRADAAGAIDLATDPAESGSYTGVSGMGLIWSMAPGRAAVDGDYQWGLAGSRTFTATVIAGGQRVASVSFPRTFPPVTMRPESLSRTGFLGQFYQRAVAGTAPRPAIVVFGGSNPGMPDPFLPIALTTHGYDVLNLAYWGAPGLPSSLANIPLEYFARALTWLSHQPGVNPARIAVLGVSRGSEAAQLLGAYYPALVHAVIASVPSDVAYCSFPGCAGPAWTLHGKPLPYASQFTQTDPDADPAAVIPDQRIDGPVFLDCAGADMTWLSCLYSQAIMTLLNTHHDRWTHVLDTSPAAGHLVGALAPYEPYAFAVRAEFVPSYQAIQQAYPPLWSNLVSFLTAFAATGN